MVIRILKYRVKRGKLSPFHIRFTISGDATSGDVISVMQLPMTSFPVLQLPVTSYPVTSRSGDATSGTISLHHLK
jgi:hypothetical protein